MGSETLAIFQSTIQKTQEWLREVMHEIGRVHEQDGYQALRAVLHTLRDRLTVEEATDLGAQLPMLVRGFYYEGYNPSHSPTKIRHADEFLEAVRHHLDRRQDIDPEAAIKGVFRVINRRITKGEIADVRNGLPEPVRRWWPTDVGLG